MADKPSNVRQLTPITGGAGRSRRRLARRAARLGDAARDRGGGRDAVWLIIVAMYIHTTYGWESVSQLLPHDSVLASPASPHRSPSSGWSSRSSSAGGAAPGRPDRPSARRLTTAGRQSVRYQSVAQACASEQDPERRWSAAERHEEGRKSIAAQTEELNTVSSRRRCARPS